MYSWGFIILQKSKMQTVGNRKKISQLISENSNFSENAQCFVGTFL